MNVRDELERLHKQAGWEFSVKCETGSHYAWSAELRITLDPYRNGPDRSYVTFATGGRTPGEVMRAAYEDLRKWLSETSPSPAPKPCLDCTEEEN